MGVVHFQNEQKPKSKDRHRKGYFEDYAKKTGRKDRHRKGYWHDRAVSNLSEADKARIAKLEADGYKFGGYEMHNGKRCMVMRKTEKVTKTVDAVSYHLRLKELQSNLDFESASMECMGDECFGD